MNAEKKRIFLLIIFRLIIISSLFVSTFIIQFSASEFIPIFPFYYLIIISYILSLIYLGLYYLDRHYSIQAYLQIFVDLLLVTALVYIAGGLKGSFFFLYIFPIIAAGLILSSKSTYLVAALSAIFFGLMVDGLYFGLIPYFSPEQYQEVSLGAVFSTIFIAWGIFFVIAFLMNYLARNLEKTRESLHLAEKELEIKQRLAAAGQVAANLAHEVRNPLAAISGAVQVLKEELALSGSERDLMNIVIKESGRVSQTIEQFLDIASPERQVFSFFDLREVLKETLLLVRASGELDSRYEVSGNFQSSPVYFYGNPNQFKQIFWNLVKNSLKAMPEGGVLTIDFEIDKKKELKIRCADSGKGMSEEEKRRIFEPFYSGFGNGRGLGMTLVRKIIDDYEGRIEVNSELERGTEIRITLPIRKRIPGNGTFIRGKSHLKNFTE